MSRGRRVARVALLFLGVAISATVLYGQWNKTHAPLPDLLKAQASEEVAIEVDFGKQIAVGSPLVFGGVEEPRLGDRKAWDLLAEAGVTMIRRAFWMETELPTNISLDDYKQNRNNVQDPSTWNWSTGWNNITTVNEAFQNSQKRGMKVMAILAYSPAWLTYSGNVHGVPRDWDVYRDIVKKLYRIHRPYLDMIEIWNEPTYPRFLDINKSPYKTQSAAYVDLYKNAVQAIQEVNREANDGRLIPIIAVSGHTPTDTSVLDGFLKAQVGPVDAISYHNYHIDEPSDQTYKKVLAKYGKNNMPLFLDEWNYSPDEKKSSLFQTDNPAIAYTGKKLIGFLKMGLAGAGYYSTTFNDLARPNSIDSTFGFYRLDKSGNPYLLPQGKTWRLLSKSLGLGVGESRVVNITSPVDITAIGFINSAGRRGSAAVNEGGLDRLVQIRTINARLNGRATVKIYEASAYEDGGAPVCTGEVESKEGNVNFKLIVPAQAVVGVTINPAEISLGRMMRVLGVSTSNTCLFE